jgi:outer membrane protein TolC
VAERPRKPWTSEPPVVEPRIAAVSSATPAPILSGQVPIDLPTVLELAGERPNAIRLARERLHEAEAKVEKATADFLPTVMLGGLFQQHFGNTQRIEGEFIEVNKQRLFLGGAALLTLDPATDIFNLLAAQQRRQTAEDEIETVSQDRGLAAAEAYFELVGAQAALAIARDQLEHARAFAELARARERRAVGLRVDTLRAEAEVSNGQLAVIAAEERFRVASARLATLLRLDARITLFTAEDRVHPLTFFAADASVDRLIDTALETRPDLRAQEGRVAAADREHDGAVFGPLLPKIFAGSGPLLPLAQGGGIGVEGPNFGDLKEREDYFVGAFFIFSGFGLGDLAEAHRLDAKLRAERVVADDLREQVIREVIESHEAVRSRRAAIDVAEEELRAADESRAITTKRLEQGAGLAVEVLAAEEVRTRAATHLVDAVVGYNKSQYRLLVRIGRRPIATR